MSARGARSRKVQQKEVEKKEKRDLAKGKAPDPYYERHDAFAEWHQSPSTSTSNSRSGIARSLTISSHNTDASSDSRSHHLKSPAADSASVSDKSLQGRENMKFQNKGKDIKAPRGRGGGVPPKKSVAPPSAPPAFRSDSAASHVLSPNQKTWVNFKVWQGGRDGMRPYGGFEYVTLGRPIHNTLELIKYARMKTCSTAACSSTSKKSKWTRIAPHPP